MSDTLQPTRAWDQQTNLIFVSQRTSWFEEKSQNQNMVWKASYCLSWLQEHYAMDEEFGITTETIHTKFRNDGGVVNNNTFGKYVRALFKNVQILRKSGKYHYNLKEREVEETYGTMVDLELIQQWVPSPFFLCEKSDKEAHFVCFCELINGNHVTKKIIFKYNGEWELHVSSTNINLESLSIENNFCCTRTSVQNVCSIVLILNTCKGKENQTLCPDDTKNKNYIVEFLGESKTKIYRSNICTRVMTPTSISQTCRPCQNSIRFAHNENEVPDSSNSGNLDDSRCDFSQENDMEHSESVNAGNTSGDDTKAAIEKVLPEASSEMLDLLVNQKKNLKRKPNGRRWDGNTKSFCLSLWRRSHKNYQQLRDSKMLILPSGSTMQGYKKRTADTHD